MQSVPQSIPVPVTVPVPVPALATVRVGGAVKLAVTFVAPATGTTQSPVPEQAPPQLTKLVPTAVGAACKVTEVLLL